MAKKNISLADFPEEIDHVNGVRIYGEASYENEIAILSHYLHHMALYGKGDDTAHHQEVVEAIKAYLDHYGVLHNYEDEDIHKVCDAPFAGDLFSDFMNVPFPGPKHPRFTFIDLFAGIGGFRLAMQAHGGACVFSSEWNKFSKKTYLANYGEMPFGDITLDATKDFIPEDFDILCAGFPCQPFSIAGVAKKNSLGRPTGFADKTQGTLFFDVAEILRRHRPKAFFLENVKNLVSHDKGNTFKVIQETLEELDYSIYYKVMDGKAFVPQHRERIIIVGFDKKRYHGKEQFKFPDLGDPQNRVKDILEGYVDAKYTLSDKLWDYLQNYAVRQKAKGNGFGFGLVDLNGITRTLSARYYKDGSEILIPQEEGLNPRKLTPRECARLMGYPDSFIINAVSDVQAYKQCGNSVIVPLVFAVADEIMKTLKID